VRRGNVRHSMQPLMDVDCNIVLHRCIKFIMYIITILLLILLVSIIE